MAAAKKKPAKKKASARKKRDVVLPIDQWIAEAKAAVRRRRKELKAQPPKPYWQVWVDAGKSIPQEDWDKVPHDGSYNHDHYLYGTPKKTLDD